MVGTVTPCMLLLELQTIVNVCRLGGEDELVGAASGAWRREPWHCHITLAAD